MHHVIGFTGKMGAGKDTAAEFISGTHRRMAFADALKHEVFDSMVRKVLPPGCPVSRKDVAGHNPHTKPTPPVMRALLQWWGTEYRRAQCENYWVNRLLYYMHPKEATAITDVRFANEAEAIRSIGGVVIRITGRETPNNGIAGHVSEALDFPVDAEVVNDGTIEQFKERLLECLNSLKKK
jgi:hypothetical protein